MELRPPLIWKISNPLWIAAAFYFFVWPWVARLLEVLHARDLASALGMLSVVVLVVGLASWWVWNGASKMMRELSFSIRADEKSITMNYRSKTTTIPWHQVHGCTIEPRGPGGLGTWVTLRDAQGRVLLQWERSWFAYTNATLKQFDRFTDFVRLKVAQHGASST